MVGTQDGGVNGGLGGLVVGARVQVGVDVVVAGRGLGTDRVSLADAVAAGSCCPDGVTTSMSKSAASLEEITENLASALFSPTVTFFT